MLSDLSIYFIGLMIVSGIGALLVTRARKKQEQELTRK